MSQDHTKEVPSKEAQVERLKEAAVRNDFANMILVRNIIARVSKS